MTLECFLGCAHHQLLCDSQMVVITICMGGMGTGTANVARIQAQINLDLQYLTGLYNTRLVLRKMFNQFSPHPFSR